MIRFIEPHRGLRLQDYEADLHLAPLVAGLRATAAEYLRLDGHTIFVVNSTEHGGGVAEMLPSQIGLLRDLGVDARWVVIEPKQQAFFDLTKRIHNALHGHARPRVTPEDRALYEAVSLEAANALAPRMKRGDLLIVHDPQPAGMGALLAERLSIHTIWRCHIGLDERTTTTDEAWDFLRPFVSAYDRTVFSLPEYAPPFLRDHAVVIPPAIDPLSHKNRELSIHKLCGILANSKLAVPTEPILCEDFDEPVKRLAPGGEFMPAVEDGDIGILFRPIVTQVSRWDHLKGFAPLLDGFVRYKTGGRVSEHPDRESGYRTRRRQQLVRLVLAGPAPEAISDDPEGRAVLAELCERWLALPPELQQDVALLSLPMGSRKANALIVNALQRCSTVVVQNSLREGFGLTVTEAMNKACFVLGTRAAGVRAQIDDGVHGRLIHDATDPAEIALALKASLSDPLGRHQMGRNARRRVGERYLTPTQLRQWVKLFSELVT